MGLFKSRPKCPNCNTPMSSRPSRKQECPHCGKLILVRRGDLVTEEQAQIMDWMARLEVLGVSSRDFQEHRRNLSEQFGHPASINDTIWRILNSLVVQYANDRSALEHIYREMAALVSSEGKDPTQYLQQAESVRVSRTGSANEEVKRVFLGHDELSYTRKLRAEGKLDQAEELLRRGEPSAAVLDELRKVSSSRAHAARKQGDWSAVVAHLTGYTEYAAEMRDYCIRMVNQEPPDHTERDKKLLEKAKEKLA